MLRDGAMISVEINRALSVRVRVVRSICSRSRFGSSIGGRTDRTLYDTRPSTIHRDFWRIRPHVYRKLSKLGEPAAGHWSGGFGDPAGCHGRRCDGRRSTRRPEAPRSTCALVASAGRFCRRADFFNFALESGSGPRASTFNVRNGSVCEIDVAPGNALAQRCTGSGYSQRPPSSSYGPNRRRNNS